MGQLQVILYGMPSGAVETGDGDIVLQFDEDRSYESALWMIPGFPEYLPANLLSELRTLDSKSFNVLVEGPEGFQSGPHLSNWVRCGYPRGKLVSFLEMGGGKTTGVSLSVIEGSLVLDEVHLGG